MSVSAPLSNKELEDLSPLPYLSILIVVYLTLKENMLASIGAFCIVIYNPCTKMMTFPSLRVGKKMRARKGERVLDVVYWYCGM